MVRFIVVYRAHVCNFPCDVRLDGRFWLRDFRCRLKPCAPSRTQEAFAGRDVICDTLELTCSTICG